MKRLVGIVVLMMLMCCFAQGLWAADMTNLITEGVKELGVEKGSPDLLALTNATYVKVNGETTEGIVDVIGDITGCSMGKKNLLLYHRPVNSPLKVVLFVKNSGGNAVIITDNGQQAGKISLKMGIDQALTPDGWKTIQQQLGPDTFTLVSITDAWAKNAPYDFLKCCEFHNHLCPGVSSGYQIAQFIMDTYPLNKGEAYTWIAAPNWCKEDAIQILLDLTPGKKNLYVKNLTAEQKKAVLGETATDNIGGILIIWDNKAKTGKAVALRYNWGKARSISGVAEEDFAPKGGKTNPLFWISRLKCNTGLAPYLSTPADFVTVVKEVPVTQQMVTDMTRAGVNPYEVIELMN